MRDKWKLLPEKLRKVKRTDSWKLEDTDDISAPGAGTAGLIGQERAIESMEFGLSVPGRGYNVFVLGRPGSGRTSYALDSLRKRAAALPVPTKKCRRQPYRPSCPFHRGILPKIAHREARWRT